MADHPHRPRLSAPSYDFISSARFIETAQLLCDDELTTSDDREKQAQKKQNTAEAASAHTRGTQIANKKKKRKKNSPIPHHTHYTTPKINQPWQIRLDCPTTNNMAYTVSIAAVQPFIKIGRPSRRFRSAAFTHSSSDTRSLEEPTHGDKHRVSCRPDKPTTTNHTATIIRPLMKNKSVDFNVAIDLLDEDSASHHPDGAAHGSKRGAEQAPETKPSKCREKGHSGWTKEKVGRRDGMGLDAAAYRGFSFN